MNQRISQEMDNPVAVSNLVVRLTDLADTALRMGKRSIAPAILVAIGIHIDSRNNRDFATFERNMHAQYAHMPLVQYTPQQGDSLRACARSQGYGGTAYFTGHDRAATYISFAREKNGRALLNDELQPGVEVRLPAHFTLNCRP